jgi:O-antigen/teichoic acid export membrane protein
MKSRSIFSMASLLFQSSYSAVLGFVAFFILTLNSGAALLGIYSTVLASMSFFNYITNLGLAAALIQKKETEETDLSTAFFIQFILVTIAVGIGFYFGDRLLAGYKDLPANTIYLYWALLISLFLLSLKTIPSVLLEKNVEIYKNVLVSSVENTLFYLTIIVAVIAGYEMEALIAAVLIRAAVGVGLLYFMKPWKPGLSFSFASAKELLAYGLPFQGNSFLALIKDDLLIIYLGQVIGLGNLGIVSFGKKYAEMAVRLVTDNVNRVAFPVFARVQDNKELLGKSLSNVLFYGSVIVFPIIIGGMFTFDSFLRIVEGYYDKWSPALFSFYFFSLSTLFVSLTTPFINLFNAVKKVRTSLLFMVLWTVMMWVLIPPAVNLYGFNAVSVVFFIQSLTFFLVVWQAKTVVDFDMTKAIKGVLLGSILTAAYLGIIRWISLAIFTSEEVHLVFSLLGAPMVYGGTVIAIHGVDAFKDVLRTLRPGAAAASPPADQP